MGRFDFSKFEQFANKVERELGEEQVRLFMEACAKELAARLLAKVIRRTPVGNYYQEVEVTAKRTSKNHKRGDIYTKRINTTGKIGGTLRRGWTAGQDAAGYANSLPIYSSGSVFVIEVINPVEYASYVEYGHRQEPGRYVAAIGKRLKRSWVEGKFMLTISTQEIEADSPRLLEEKIRRKLEEVFK